MNYLLACLLVLELLVGCRPTLPDTPLPDGTVIESLAVFKKARQMQVFRNRQLLKTYTIQLGDAPVGPKQFEGDERTPEGCYIINDRNPASGYHKNLGISYPTEAQRAYAKTQGQSAGGDVKIHGLPNATSIPEGLFKLDDWTNGCIAVSNQEVDELYRCVQPNVPICIFP
ncbi:MAG: hypothetical protein EOP52_01130 [Sphingobacteriales bacterium]|nr:MAG: hypothetical protein EOP52_01130 [Sphingobacteriales bacterium]